MNDKYLKTDDDYLDELLGFTGKQGCEQTKTKLRVSLGLVDDESLVITFNPSPLSFFGIKALQALIRQNAKAEARDSAGFDRFKKQTQRFKKHLEGVLGFIGSREGKQYFSYMTYRDAEVSYECRVKDYQRTFDGLQRMHLEVSAFTTSQASRGRPSLEALYDYVYHLAMLFEELSGQPFKLNKEASEPKDSERTKPEEKVYPALTQGHGFVYAVIEWLNDETVQNGCDAQYTSANIYNACEQAKKRMNAASS